ncbi:MAG: carbohydrate-binding protein, partial [Pedobacter sp.]
MIFNKIFKYTLLFGGLLCASSGVKSQGFLQTQGSLIVNDSGEKVILRGMGLGGWMLQEGYMFRLSNLGQQYRIKEEIAKLVGDNKANEFYDLWLANHTRKIDIDAMAAWGFNSIRLPMHYNLYTLPIEQEPTKGENTWLEKGFIMTDSLLQWCKANKLYLILDLHAAPGGQGNDLAISDRDPAKPSLWDSEENQKKTVALWRKLAERYKDEPWIGGYDIINEPNWGFEDSKDFRGTEEKTNAPLKKLMVDITKAIREVDKKHIIIIEGNGFGNNYRGILPVWDKNMVVSFHKYGNFNTEEAIQNFLDIQQQQNVPVWLGESGENSNTWFTEAISLVEKHNIGWAWWQEKKIGVNNPLEIKLTPAYQKLLDYWNGKGDKPSVEFAWNTLKEFAFNTRLENNILQKDVIDAMFRQVNSTETKPFKIHKVQNNFLLSAVDYDLGRQNYAYFDKDTASYHYTPGVNTVGNRGRVYRNDGVDIQMDSGGYHIYNIEDGEWLQYTLQVAKEGSYTLQFNVASEVDGGQLSVLSSSGETLVQNILIPATGSKDAWEMVEAKKVKLAKGENRIRVKAAKGGFNFKSI